MDLRGVIERHLKVINELTTKLYDDYRDTLVFDINQPNIFNLSYIPVLYNLRLYINGVFYPETCYTVDRENKQITWLNTASNGGFDLDASYNIVAIYDVSITENP